MISAFSPITGRMGYLEKSRLEAFDLIITVLQEHEEHLDNMLNRLDSLVETLSTITIRMDYHFKRIEENQKQR